MDVPLLVALVAVTAAAVFGWTRRPVVVRPELRIEDERRQDYELFLRLLAGLDTLEERYHKFTRRILAVVALVGLTAAVALALNAKQAADQREGRALAIDALCAATSGVINAGRATLTEQRLPPRLERHLMRYGYPSREVRQAAAEESARRYGRMIASTVERQANIKAHIAKPDGTLDCSLLKRAARAGG